MDATFWHQRWKNNDIGFHMEKANPLLVKYFHTLSLKKSQRIFVPLCGKTRDIEWFLSEGYHVTGVELSETAINQLFDGLNITPNRFDLGTHTHYSGKNIDIFVGDIFALSADILGHTDAAYDRAALVALPKEMRQHYIIHLMKITLKAPQLLICYEYDQSKMNGPPFSITDEEVKQHYQKHYHLSKLASLDVPGGIKGQCAGQENVWLLGNK